MRTPRAPVGTDLPCAGAEVRRGRVHGAPQRAEGLERLRALRREPGAPAALPAPADRTLHAVHRPRMCSHHGCVQVA